MASLWKKAEQVSGASSAAAAKIYEPRGSGAVNVVTDYTWTLTPPASRKEIPTIELAEFQVDESIIARQINFYVNSLRNSFASSNDDYLSPYDSLFPKDKETKFNYVFPYYTDINFEVNTPQWASLDTLESAKGAAMDIGSLIGGRLGEEIVSKGINLAAGVAGGVLAANYPKVGIMDRPKLWQSHDFRSYTVKFPLYNTYNTDPNSQEWIKNRELCELLINQNLYNKLTFITGIPPVFYEVLIPGQHYSPAACVTNLTVYNRGNMRQFVSEGYTFNVPDVYEINMTLTDLVIPSKNLFQAISESRVRSSFRTRSASPEPVQVAQNAVASTVSTIANNPVAQAGVQAFNLVTNPVGTAVNAANNIFNSLNPNQ